jgi:hypothetical protein
MIIKIKVRLDLGRNFHFDIYGAIPFEGECKESQLEKTIHRVKTNLFLHPFF